MEFGIFQNGFRPHTSAARTYDEDLSELVLADQLGFRDAWISEHHGEPVYIDKVDTCPVPELLMCKAAGLTRRLRMGAAVNVIHLAHPVDTAIKAATTDQMLGGGRYMFGFGSGFPNPMFANERGLSFEDRHERLMEALDLILKCWASDQPFDWQGKHWKGKGILALPKPVNRPHPVIATASETESTVKLAAERGYTLLAAQLEAAASFRRKADKYAAAALAAGRGDPLSRISVARNIYIAGSVEEARNDLRPAINHEIGFQKQRGLLRLVKSILDLPTAPEDITFDDFYDAGMYLIGDADTVTERLMQFWKDSGGFGTLMVVTGKDWADHDKRARSLRLFMEQVAPHLRDLQPTRRLEPAPA